ncbi:ABC transporter permease [Streptomyces silvisoli]|uniref:ABC transporter permease n=1 Tax=Streptomyces silvisoli TaxID=3034235 RepID=A0ABT5ZMZ7_9ACTN|nr:ABC transporter permease [Streptomyces silvisoli]MDF3291196.1 ABC transporter permease [Streptomyces silvisoli]
MFFTYLRRELRRRVRAAFAIALGLALGTGLVVTVSSVATGTGQAKGQVVQSLYGRGTDLTVTTAASPPKADFTAHPAGPADGDDHVTVQGGQSLDSSVVSRVRGQSGVADAAGGLGLRIVKGGGHDSRGRGQSLPAGADSTGEINGQHGFGGYGGVTAGHSGGAARGGGQATADDYRAYGVDVSHPGIGPLTAVTITSGTGFSAKQTDDKVAVVDRDYARRTSLAVGRALTVHGSTFKVIGIATAADPTAEVYLPLHQAQALANAPGKVSTVYVRATDPGHVGTAKSAIQHHVPGIRVTTSAELAAHVTGSLSTASNLASTVGRWLSATVLAAAFLAAGLLTWSAVGRRTREFATLRALGWSSGRVVRQVVGEALVNGLIGGALGITLGLAAAYALTTASPMLTARVGSAGTLPHIALTAPVNATTIVVAAALAVGGGLVAAGVGGWRASRLRPADALHRVE